MFFEFDIGRVVYSVKEMGKLMDCSYKEVWDNYTHDAVKEQFTWEEIEQLLKD